MIIINVYIFRKEISTFHENYDGDIGILPKISVFEKITKYMFFAILLSKHSRKKNSNCYKFLLIFELSCQIRSNI